MALNLTIATCTLESISPYSQSRKHDEPALQGELKDAYDKRTWRSLLHVSNGTVHIPSNSIHQCLANAAKYSKKQIPGQGKATWTKKFEAGIVLFEDIDLNIKPEEVDYIDIYANADGIRGSGKRVMKRFPMIHRWKATFDVHILDPIITRPVFEEMVEIAGMFIGIGRGRPENLGKNGRFKLVELAWKDGRNPILEKAA